MSTYQSLLQQKAELDAQIAEAQKREKSAAVTQARELVAQYGLTADDVFGKYTSAGIRTAAGKRATVAPKYRDPATGATWTGRGKPPKWIADQDRASFAI
ncbi:H-NS histone family protein [Comamonas terrigena]|uniref:H-NS histone family protein n=1 Tax=Comamonas terrigena TaxID=32013 RepID=UPI0028AB6FE2|nr:H-NS histone family protein [Comamonas terrigena]